jgi:hypothetical protein
MILGITDQSAFYDVRMRNNFEHFDEKLEDWLREVPDRVCIDKQIGPLLPAGRDTKKNLRVFDPETWELGFWDQRFDVGAICSEARGLMPEAETDDYAGVEPPEDWDEIRKISEKLEHQGVILDRFAWRIRRSSDGNRTGHTG